MFPSRRFFDVRDEEVLRFLDRSNLLERYWPCVNAVMQPLLGGEEVSCFIHLYSVMLDLGSAFFHHFLNKFLEHLLDEEYSELSSVLDVIVDGDDTLYQFVWMCVKDGKLTTLSKSSVTFLSREECLSNGIRYQPSLDLSSGESLLLSWERVCSGCIRKRPNPSLWKKADEREGAMKIGEVLYEYLHACNDFIFRMPWTVVEKEKHLYIYYMQGFDLWFYSYSKNIFEAYHEHMLHN